MSSGVVYLYDGTFDGLMTAVFEAFAHRPQPDGIKEAATYQARFGERAVYIEPDTSKAGRVVRGVTEKMGQEAYEKVWLTFLSEQYDRGNAIYGYIRIGMRVGRDIHRLLADDSVAAVEKYSRAVAGEQLRWMQFLRFSKRCGGTYYAPITPLYDVLALIMPHFVDRMNVQPFIIHDKKRHLFGIYDRRTWYLITAEEMALPPAAAEQYNYEELWKRFYDTVAIGERFNPRLRMQHCPKRFWGDMTEMSMVVPKE